MRCRTRRRRRRPRTGARRRPARSDDDDLRTRCACLATFCNASIHAEVRGRLDVVSVAASARSRGPAPASAPGWASGIGGPRPVPWSASRGWVESARQVTELVERLPASSPRRSWSIAQARAGLRSMSRPRQARTERRAPPGVACAPSWMSRSSRRRSASWAATIRDGTRRELGRLARRSRRPRLKLRGQPDVRQDHRPGREVPATGCPRPGERSRPEPPLRGSRRGARSWHRTRRVASGTLGRAPSATAPAARRPRGARPCRAGRAPPIRSQTSARAAPVPSAITRAIRGSRSCVAKVPASRSLNRKGPRRARPAPRRHPLAKRWDALAHGLERDRDDGRRSDDRPTFGSPRCRPRSRARRRSPRRPR